MSNPTWRTAEFVYIEIPRCPHCGGTKFKTVRCEVGGDGSRSRKSICCGCSERVVLVFEMPEENSLTLPRSGNHDIGG